MCSLAAGIAKGICLGLLIINFNPKLVVAAENILPFSNRDHSLYVPQVARTSSTVKAQLAVTPYIKRANFEGEPKSKNAQRVGDWVVDSGDNRGMPFAIVDKVDAKVFVFDARGRLRGAAPALLGMARGDYAVRGIGDRELSDIRPEERTTPAGRFVASMGMNSKRKDVLWVDYKDAISLHRVITDNPRERRLERLATPTPLDNRISYGCINVPTYFFDHVVKPTCHGISCMVYVMPETRSISEIFRSYYDLELDQENRTAENIGNRTRPKLQQDLRSGRHRASTLDPNL